MKKVSSDVGHGVTRASDVCDSIACLYFLAGRGKMVGLLDYGQNDNHDYFDIELSNYLFSTIMPQLWKHVVFISLKNTF